MGEHTYGEPTVVGSHEITIGKYCAIAHGVEILSLGDHHYEWITTYPFHQIDSYGIHKNYPPGAKRDTSIVIGNDVWIGWGATILHGSFIGDGAVIGAKAVVVGEVRPYSIVVGNPAKEIKRRFDDETVDKLLKLKWWDWPDERVKANYHHLLSANFEWICQQLSSQQEETTG